MTEQELREKIKKILSDTMRWQPYYAIMRSIVYEQDLDNLADALIEAGCTFNNKHRVLFENVSLPNEYIGNECFFIPKTQTKIKQLYGDEEVEQIVKERDEYKNRIRLTERALFRACGSSQMMLVFLQKAEKELQEERKDD